MVANPSEILVKLWNFSLWIVYLKMLSTMTWPFCKCIEVLRSSCKDIERTVVCAISAMPKRNIHFSHMLRGLCHYNDVIMGAIASQITSLTIVYLTVYSDQRPEIPCYYWVLQHIDKAAKHKCKIDVTLRWQVIRRGLSTIPWTIHFDDKPCASNYAKIMSRGFVIRWVSNTQCQLYPEH